MQRAVPRRPEGNGSSEGREVERLAPAAVGRAQMSAALRRLVLAAAALLWFSGVWWLVLHYAFAQQTPFGELPNPSEPLAMRVHGVLAVGAVFLLGWIAGGHVIERWDGARRRLSGLLLSATAAVLVVSGYALYYTTGFPHELASLAHQGLGALAIVAALVHGWRRRPMR
jgi:hypothetical protein